MRRRKLDGVLLDVDGTLIDSNAAHAESWSDTLAEFGRPTPPEKVRPLIGMGGDKLLPQLLGVEADSADGKKFSERRAEIFREHYVPKLRLTRGAKQFVERLRREGFRIIIATSAKEEELEAMLQQVGLDDLIPHRTSADDAEESKPDPDIVQAALRKAKLHPDAAIMLGDTPYDVEAARRAGIDCVAVLTGGWNSEALKEAVAIYDDPDDILRHFTASPFAAGA
ncbi:MAG TPA: HAD family hydrolase [Gemmatimonadaceae bacterium]|nr:HAD family hydrolase [Gemmatimonadaceae bacterium]